jgi:Spy/CpxP family protein refolding chaperone
VTVRLFLVLCILFLFAPLYAQQSYREFERELNLSECQRAQVDGIKRKYMNEWRALNDESARKRIELRELYLYRPDQRERAARLERDLYQIEASRQRLFRAYRGEISTVFTNEQRGRFNRFTEQENRGAVRGVRPADPQPGRRFYGR